MKLNSARAYVFWPLCFAEKSLIPEGLQAKSIQILLWGGNQSAEAKVNLPPTA